MVRYKLTYQRYIVLMGQLKGEIDAIINLTPDNRRKLLAFEICNAIDETVKTAEVGINLPSEELLCITKKVILLRECGSSPISPVLSLWQKSLSTLYAVCEALSSITDDTYLSSARELLAAVK